MQDPYSETFIRTATVGPLITYTVPVGRRAVIKCVTAVAIGTGVAGPAYLVVAGTPVFGATLQAGFNFAIGNLVIVAYAGDTIGLALSVAGQSASVSGFLLGDPSGRAGAPGLVGEHELSALELQALGQAA